MGLYKSLLCLQTKLQCEEIKGVRLCCLCAQEGLQEFVATTVKFQPFSILLVVETWRLVVCLCVCGGGGSQARFGQLCDAERGGGAAPGGNQSINTRPHT